jgi:hypothetical protein
MDTSQTILAVGYIALLAIAIYGLGFWMGIGFFVLQLLPLCWIWSGSHSEWLTALLGVQVGACIQPAIQERKKRLSEREELKRLSERYSGKVL